MRTLEQILGLGDPGEPPNKAAKEPAAAPASHHQSPQKTAKEPATAPKPATEGPKPCSGCASPVFWRSHERGRLICASCHPPRPRSLAKQWLAIIVMPDGRRRYADHIAEMRKAAWQRAGGERMREMGWDVKLDKDGEIAELVKMENSSRKSASAPKQQPRLFPLGGTQP